MKRILSLLLLMTAGCVAFAAAPAGSPSFRSFNTNQFDTAGSQVSINNEFTLGPSGELFIGTDGSYTDVSGIKFELYSDTTSAYLFLGFGNVGVSLDPATSGGQTPAKFDTFGISHTSGNLLELKNNTTNKFWVTFDGIVHCVDIVTDNPVTEIWTESNGTIQAISGVVDAVSATAFLLNTENSLTENGSFILKAQNHSTNVFELEYDGSMILGSGNALSFNLADGHARVRGDVGLQEFTLYCDSNDSYLDLRSGGTRLWPTIPNDGSIPYVFDTTVAHTSGDLFWVANNGTNKVWITFDGELHAKDFVMEASAIKTSTTPGHSGAIQAYDDNDATYRTFATLQNGNIPSLTIAPPAGGVVNLQGIYKSSDGTAGLTTNITAGLVTFTIKNGIITGVSL